MFFSFIYVGFQCPHDGLFRHPYDCTQFYECYRDRFIERTCSEPLVFNTDIEMCDHIFNVPECETYIDETAQKLLPISQSEPPVLWEKTKMEPPTTPTPSQMPEPNKLIQSLWDNDEAERMVMKDTLKMFPEFQSPYFLDKKDKKRVSDAESDYFEEELMFGEQEDEQSIFKQPAIATRAFKPPNTLGINIKLPL